MEIAIADSQFEAAVLGVGVVDAQQCFPTAASSCTVRRDRLRCRAALSGCLSETTTATDYSSSRTLDCRRQLGSTYSLTARASAKCSKDVAGANLIGSTPIRLELSEIEIHTYIYVSTDWFGSQCFQMVLVLNLVLEVWKFESESCDCNVLKRSQIRMC